MSDEHETDRDITRLQAVADWMRTNGVMGLRLYDGTELRLDPSWSPVRDTAPEMTETKTSEEKLKELALHRATRERRPFRHVRR